jgi:hypothetical protein
VFPVVLYSISSFKKLKKYRLVIYRVHHNVDANQTIFLISVGLAIRNEVAAFALLKVRMEKDELKQGLHESINFWGQVFYTRSSHVKIKIEP